MGVTSSTGASLPSRSATERRAGPRGAAPGALLKAQPLFQALDAGALARLAADRRGRVAAAAILAAHAGPALLQTPRGHIPYFNFIAGGTDGGHRFLADSNLDWGQDLPRLAAWMRANGVDEVDLAYHGPDHPARFGIRRKDLVGIHHYAPETADRLTGVVVVSPNLWLDVFSMAEDPYAGLRERTPDDRAGVFFVYRMRR